MFWRVLFKNVFLKFFKSDVALLTSCQSQTFMHHLIPNAFAQLCLSVRPRFVSHSPADSPPLLFLLLLLFSYRSVSSKVLKLLIVILFPQFFFMALLFSPFLPVQIPPILQRFHQGPFLLPASLWGLHLVGESEMMVSCSSVLESRPKAIIRKKSVTFQIYFQ